MIKVEVAYAEPDKQKIIEVEVEAGTTILQAILRSNMMTLFPHIDLAKQKVGIFGKGCQLSDVVKEGDRIEIYRPLIIDPKEARRTKERRLKKLKQNKT